MKKLLNISVVAALTVLPFTANATPVAGEPAHADPATVASAVPGYALAEVESNDGDLATAGYVKGAYNSAIKAINKVAATADTAVQSVTAGTANGTISVDSGSDITVYDDSALSGRVTAVENTIGNTTLTTTAQTLTGAIEEVKSSAGFAGTASELTDTNFQAADKTSAAKAANAAMAAAAAAQSDVDAVENTIGNTTLTTTAQTLTGAIEEVKSNALTSSSLTDYAKKTGVTQTITDSTIAGTVPVVATWGSNTETTVAITASITGATYAEPANP